MLENIAMWGGIAGIAVAIFAVIILFLTRQSIVHILNKDTILFDQNFEIKQKAVSSAMALTDELIANGNIIKTNPEFASKAKQVYNELLCVLSDVRIADEFYNIAIDLNTPFNPARVAQFKLMCRKDIGLKVGKALTVKRVLAEQKLQAQPIQQPIQPVQQPTPVQQAVPMQPIQAPIQETPVQRVQAPMQPTQQPVRRVAPQPGARPVAPQARPVQAQPVRRVQPSNPNDKPNA